MPSDIFWIECGSVPCNFANIQSYLRIHIKPCSVLIWAWRGIIIYGSQSIQCTSNLKYFTKLILNKFIKCAFILKTEL